MSQLIGIIRRLHAMQEDDSSEKQVRRFEKEGVPICEVSFLRATKAFEVENYALSHKYCFDDIDMAAIEIFDAFQESE